MASISDILTAGKAFAGASGGTASGVIGRLNTAAGTVFNAVGAGSAIINSVKSIFGFDEPDEGSEARSAINKMRSYLSKNDILSNNLFYVTISIPKILKASHGEMAADLSLLCYSATLPGVAFATSQVNRYGVGVSEKRPTVPMFTDSTLSFIGDGRGEVRDFFYKWMMNIIKFDSKTSNPSPGSRMAPFEVDYKENYQCQIDIVVLNRANKEIIKVSLNDAFPIALGDQNLSWQDMDSMMSVPVTFTFYNWTCETIDVSDVADGGEPSMSLLSKLVKVGTAVQTLATLKRPRSIGDIVNVTRNATSAINGIKGFI